MEGDVFQLPIPSSISTISNGSESYLRDIKVKRVWKSRIYTVGGTLSDYVHSFDIWRGSRPKTWDKNNTSCRWYHVGHGCILPGRFSLESGN